MLENRMVTGEEYPSYLRAEEPVTCRVRVTVWDYSNRNRIGVTYKDCGLLGVEGTETCSCTLHGLAECAEWRGELVAEGGSVGEWAALELNERLYREAAAR